MVESTGDLQAVFKQYCGKETTLDGKSFAKLTKDTKLLDKKLTSTDIDLIFAKVKDKAARRITFAQFQNGIEQIAAKKKVDASAIAATIAAGKGPVLKGTKAEANKFHDDKSLYTGVHAKGGPSTVDTDKVIDISQTCNRSDADVRGTVFQGEVDHVTQGVAGVFVEEKKAAPKKKAAAPKAEAVPAGSLKEVFSKFSAGGKEIDGKTFAKFAKDTKLINKSLTTTDIDLIFAKVKDKAARKITFAQFKNGLELIAQKRKQTPEELEELILSSGGPVFAGTKAQANKFHDDKSLYTGVHGKGGPSTVDTDKIADISQTCDRTAADVRGRKI